MQKRRTVPMTLPRGPSKLRAEKTNFLETLIE
jgi:hypothetical protein